MLAKYFLITRNYVLSVSSQRKHSFYHQNTLLDAFRMTSLNITGRNPSMVIPLLANQDLTPMLMQNMMKCSIFIRCQSVKDLLQTQTPFKKALRSVDRLRYSLAPRNLHTVNKQRCNGKGETA